MHHNYLCDTVAKRLGILCKVFCPSQVVESLVLDLQEHLDTFFLARPNVEVLFGMSTVRVVSASICMHC